MPVFSWIRPAHKRWVAMLFLLCWVVPFLGVIGFSIGGGTPLNGSSKARPLSAEQTADPTDRQKEVVVRTEPQRTVVPAAETTMPLEPAQTGTTTAPATTPAASGREVDPIDLNLLARVIYAEARGEPLKGQVAVGAVLINRIRNQKFPDDLWSVVFKRGEFCTVRDGQVWLEPDAEAYRAAQLAKDGWDPTNGALYFYNPSRTTSRWIWSRTVTTRIGRHVFAV